MNSTDEEIQKRLAGYMGLIPDARSDLREMKDEETKWFLICNRDLQRGSAWEIFMQEVSTTPIYRILNSRLQAAGHGGVDEELQALVAGICARPGDAVMWAYTLATAAFTNGGKLTLDDMFRHLQAPFAFGLPTRAFLDRRWQEQKLDGMNLLDRTNLWPCRY